MALAAHVATAAVFCSRSGVHCNRAVLIADHCGICMGRKRLDRLVWWRRHVMACRLRRLILYGPGRIVRNNCSVPAMPMGRRHRTRREPRTGENQCEDQQDAAGGGEEWMHGDNQEQDRKGDGDPPRVQVLLFT